MATIHIKDETYNRLARQAAARNTTVEALVQPVLEQAAQGLSLDQTSPLFAAAEREKALDDWMALVQKRSDRYPPDFAVDDSRESIYQGRGE